MSTPGSGQSKGDVETELIRLSVRGQDERVLYFKINPALKLRKLFQTYCERKQMDYHSTQFVYNGERIRANQTPQQAGIEDEAEIDAFIHQTGGAEGKKTAAAA